MAAFQHQSPHTNGMITPPRKVSGQLLRSPPSASSLQPRSRSPSHSSPLPQAQWSEIPLPYRPSDWVEPDSRPSHSRETLQPPQADPSFQWRLRPKMSMHSLSRAATSITSKRRRKRDMFLPGSHGSVEGAPLTDNPNMYAQGSPYSGSSDGHHNRSVSQPTTPDPYNAAHPKLNQEPPSFASFRSRALSPPANLNLPRAPTYPPTSSNGHINDRQVQSARLPTDAAFNDAADLHLFAQATVGLGSDSDEDPINNPHNLSHSTSFRQPQPHRRRPILETQQTTPAALPTLHSTREAGQKPYPDPETSGRRATTSDMHPSLVDLSHHTLSPISPESATLQQMQQNHHLLGLAPTSAPSPDPLPRHAPQQIQTTHNHSTVDLWLHAPTPASATYSPILDEGPPSPTTFALPHGFPSEDELEDRSVSPITPFPGSGEPPTATSSAFIPHRNMQYSPAPASRANYPAPRPHQATHPSVPTTSTSTPDPIDMAGLTDDIALNLHLETVGADAAEQAHAAGETLPDYAQSQAEAQAGLRVEATRRAQELQMRWLLSSRR